MDYKDEINRLYDLEYGDSAELFVRFAGVLLGSALLYLYSGRIAVLIWAPGFFAAHLGYFLFLRSRISARQKVIARRDGIVASCLFLVVLVSFLWMPALLVCQDDKALTVVGAALVGCILVFLVRRSDGVRFMVAGEVAVVGITVATIVATLLPEFESNLARAGAVMSSLALIGYFARAVQVGRRQRLTAEETARRSSQVQKMAAVGQLAGGVAHDFNNKLTAILGSFDLLREVDDPAEREVILESARSAAVEAARTVKHLMVYARKETVNPELQDCADLLDEAVLRTRGVITGMIKVELRRSPEPLYVNVDRSQLLMGLTNLMVNAVDAMPEGGTLILGAEAVSDETRIALADGTFLSAGPHVAISVVDTGSGIPQKLMPHVIEPFFTTKPVGKGTGLGLSAVLGMAREMGGGLGITSSATGTSVVIYLPRQPGTSARGGAGAA